MDFEYSNGVMMYYLPKELDHCSADRLKRKSEKYFEENLVRYIIFDFSKTCFMDSSGIGLITGRYRKVDASGGRVYVIHVKMNIDKILYMSGIYRIVIKKENKEEIVNDLLERDCYFN